MYQVENIISNINPCKCGCGKFPKSVRSQFVAGHNSTGTPPWNKGKKMSEEQRVKLSTYRKNNPMRWWLGKKRPDVSGEKNYQWLGDFPSYTAAHQWMSKTCGKPNYCEICKSTNAKHYDWACKNGKYSRNRKDYMRLCRSCHMRYDGQHKAMWITRRKHVQ